MRVPLVDLSRVQPEIEAEIEAGWSKVVGESSYILGPEVAEFENRYAAWCRVRHCVGVGNGTDALELALRALDVRPGNEVIVPANTFIATALAVVRGGAIPRLVDCRPATYLMDMDQAVAAVNSRTRAVIPVHLFGQMAPIEVLAEAVPALPIAEDAAQSHGATRYGQSAGSLGAIAATSFYPGKNLGAFGDAGAILTQRDDLASRVRALRNWGSDRKYFHPEAGFNSRLDTLQAVVLLAKLNRLSDWNDQRRTAAARYDLLLAGQERIVRAETLSGNYHVYHLYVVEVDERDRVLATLHEAGIGAGIHYPIPLHLQGALSGLGYRLGDFPNTERAAARMISLPIFPGITESEQELVAETLIGALAG
ncbi:MAG: DegT/DnrJ/EryC1/StrS family aminotransferase [Actinomycetota bacterium]